MRTFIAIDLDAAIRRDLGRVRERAGPALRDRVVRWVRPESIHLTLKFLGEIDSEAIHPVTEAMADACGSAAPFSFCVRGFGFFPGTRNPRVFWTGVAPDGPGLADLQGRIEGAMSRLGFRREKRAFKPHLTLARIRGRLRGLDENALLRPAHGGAETGASGADSVIGEQDVTEIVLFQSELKPSGALYVPLATVPLEGR